MNERDREAHAWALWRDAKTPELRRHLRAVYPSPFANEPEPKPRPEPFKPPANAEPSERTEFEIEGLRSRWPEEFRDGVRCAFLRRFPGERERGGYPRGFHGWTLDRRNAWFSGFNQGYHARLREAGR